MCGSWTISTCCAWRRALVTTTGFTERDISFVGYPLVIGARVLGVLATFSRWRLNEDTAATLSGIAERVAIGLDRRGVGRKLYLQDRAIAASSNGIVITDPHLPDNPIIYANYR